LRLAGTKDRARHSLSGSGFAPPSPSPRATDPSAASWYTNRVSPLGRYVVETLVMLTGVAALSVLLLTLGRRFGMGRPTGPLTLVGRLPLDGRRAVYLVRVGKTVYVVGASEHGLSKLGELNDDGLQLAQGEPEPGGFQGVLSRVLGKATGTPPSA
jgi:flagellar protein FliO/FliZ